MKPPIVTKLAMASLLVLTITAGCGGDNGPATCLTLISGTLVVGTVSLPSVMPTSTVVPFANVWLEQQSHPVQIQGGGTDTVENLIAISQANINGQFGFCVGSGTFEVVADTSALPGSNPPAPSAATITTGLAAGNTGLVIPLISTTAATVTGTVSTQKNGGAAGAGNSIQVLPLQSFTVGQTVGPPPSQGTSVQAYVPFLITSVAPTPPNLTTNKAGDGGNMKCTSACAMNTNCACYITQVPNSAPLVGAGSTTGGGYTPPAPFPPASYSIDAIATVLGTTTRDCSPSELATSSFMVSSMSSSSPSNPQQFGGCS